MFGFASADPALLEEAQRARYRAVYCGLCRALGEDRPFYFRAALSYDFVLLALLRSAAERTSLSAGRTRCGVHPLKTHETLTNAHTRYAADMNALLAFYKFADDVSDGDGAAGRLGAAVFRREATRLSQRYPAQSAAIDAGLRTLAALEKADERQAELPAAAFGGLLGAVFAEGTGAHAQTLFDFGDALGRAIYLLDAAVDLKSDLKKKRYNPLTAAGFAAAQTAVPAELERCLLALSALPASPDAALVKNVLLSGIWGRYDREKQRRERHDGPRSV